MHAQIALDALRALPSVSLAHYPTPVEELARFREALQAGVGPGSGQAGVGPGSGQAGVGPGSSQAGVGQGSSLAIPRLLVKRDDAIAFGFGGNKVRKIEMVAARALADGADTLITTGGVQSNHCRVTAAAAARLGMHCVIVANGTPPARLTGNALLDALYGAEVRYVATRQERAPAMEAAAEALRARGRHPVVIPLGASTPLGALGFVRAVGELAAQMPAPPDYIFHSTSSGGTQAGLVAGCTLHGLPTRVIGISADETAAGIQATVRSIVEGIGTLLGVDGRALASARPIEADDRFIGEGYGIPTPLSREVQQLLARTQALVVDHTYTAKALAGLVGWIREGRFRPEDTVLFWHTGGQVAVFVE